MIIEDLPKWKYIYPGIDPFNTPSIQIVREGAVVVQRMGDSCYYISLKELMDKLPKEEKYE